MNDFSADFFARQAVETDADRAYDVFKAAHSMGMTVTVVIFACLVVFFVYFFTQARKTMIAATKAAQEAKELERERLELMKAERQVAKVNLAAPVQNSGLPPLPPMPTAQPVSEVAQAVEQADAVAPADPLADDEMATETFIPTPNAPKSDEDLIDELDAD